MKIICFILMFSTHSLFSQEIKVISYNIRLDIESDGENKWDNRKEFLSDQVKFYEPDFLGVQEALPDQMDYLDMILSNYKFIGKGRDDGKSKGEHSAIFYNSEKFLLLEGNTFWLSETPEKPSKGWDASYNRICTYGLFQDKNTKKKIWVFNTHFDHIGTIARAESVKLILSKIKNLNKENLPVILTGDFNLEPETLPIKFLSSELEDAKIKSKGVVFGPTGTFNGFEFNRPVTKRIDYVFVDKLEVIKFATLSDSKNCRFPSDHFPILAILLLD